VILPGELPERIGPYRIVASLAEGGMGVVYFAEHAQTGARVALKTVRLPHEGMLSGLRREIHALARLRHPGVVPVIEQGLHGGVPWYSMPFLEGRTLGQLFTSLAQGSPGAFTPPSTTGKHENSNKSFESTPPLVRAATRVPVTGSHLAPIERATAPSSRAPLSEDAITAERTPVAPLDMASLAASGAAPLRPASGGQ